jgi:hypothetical protein
VWLDRSRYPDAASAIAAIEAAIGHKLQSFEGVAARPDSETPDTERVQQPDPGWFPAETRQPGGGAAPPSNMVHGPPDG